MTRLEAIGLLLKHYGDMSPETSDGEPVDLRHEHMVALAECGGQLDSAMTLKDLRGAVMTGGEKYGNDEITDDQLDAAVGLVMRDIAAWGRRAELLMN